MGTVAQQIFAAIGDIRWKLYCLAYLVFESPRVIGYSVLGFHFCLVLGQIRAAEGGQITRESERVSERESEGGREGERESERARKGERERERGRGRGRGSGRHTHLA